ncbi:PRD domain-containing protein [Paraclostridium ghonii]|uniref:Transcriptional antiterminator n=1 Tax=Paraclostridium ghonii TaxID=29358 RepID=A0ABU0N065_9FIRM|nr:PRD domain-containing protein [Paeniclostridium ghonii]MDQ0556552.1 transcriptional antiterminator [Paeniclostridium ghonii]
MYKIIKSFNNNVILCVEETKNKEYILIGNGIGFKATINSIFKDTDKVEKIFVINEDRYKNIEELYNSINPTYIGVATESLSIVDNSINVDMNNKSHMALLDHLVFAIERYYDNIYLENQFKAELKTLYEYEWDLAKDIVDFINKALGINLTEDEIAFVTMHINGILNKTKAVDSAKQAIIIKEAIDFLEKELGISICKNSIYYNRLIIHLRLAINRAVKGISEENMLLDHIKEKLSSSYNISETLCNYLNINHNIKLSENEIGFITLHIDRLITKTKK